MDPPLVDNGEELGLHNRIANIGAENILAEVDRKVANGIIFKAHMYRSCTKTIN